MELKKTAATLDELIAQDDEYKSQIRDLNKHRKTIKGAIRSFQRLTATLPQPKKSARRKKATAAAA